MNPTDASGKKIFPVSYGHVWTDPAHTLAKIFESSGSPGAALSEALSLGYFSQYTCYKDADLVARIVDWEASLLGCKYGDFLELFPPDFEEKASVPTATRVSFKGRTVTPDLLRNVAYTLQLRSLLAERISGAPQRVLEIGSGSGSFARVYKALNPAAQIWMADLPESLNFAHIYLRESFPAARFLFAKEAADLQGDLSGVDFIFVPLNLKDAIAGHLFDLALNIWSFGEMPNHYIREWFDIVQTKCQVAFLFTINAFLAPVGVESVERINQGEWLLNIDDRWQVLHFKINPEIHRNPFIKNFYCGLCIFAERVQSESAIEENFSAAKDGLVDTLLEDWVGVLLHEASNLGRPETNFAESSETFPTAPRYFLRQLLTTTEYIGRFNIDEGVSGTLFRLWNAFRMTKLTFAGELLVCYLAMINKTLPTQRCSKEELQILAQLKGSALREDYKAFIKRLDEFPGGSIQAACDKAIAAFQEGRLDEASDAFAQICQKAPRHGDAWHYQSLCLLRKEEYISGAACAKVATLVAPDSKPYRESALGIFAKARCAHRWNFILDSLAHGLGSRFYTRFVSARIEVLLKSKKTCEALVVCSAEFIREKTLPSNSARKLAKILSKLGRSHLANAYQALVELGA